MSDTLNKKEKILLEYALSDREVFLKAYSILKPSYFERPLDSVVKYSLDFFSKYHKVPDFDLIESETGITMKHRTVDDTDRQFTLDEVEGHCAKAAMVEAILEGADLVNGEDVNLTQIQELVRKALLVKIDNSIGLSLFDDPLLRITTMSEAVDERAIGIPKFDNMIGNIRRGELGIIYAVSSGGKSVMLANCARHLSEQKLDVSIISFELNQELYSKRLDSIVTGYDIANHFEHATDIADYLGDLKDNVGDITTKKMRARSTVEDVRAYLTEYHLVKGRYPDVLIVDYLALMGVHGRSNGKFEEQEEIAVGLRDLGVEFSMYVFTAGQINRDGQDIIKVSPAHCAGGMSVINTSDWAVAITASEEDIENNQIQVGQLKIRNSSKTANQITLYRCPKTLRITDEPVIGKQKSPLANRVKKTTESGTKAEPKQETQSKPKPAATKPKTDKKELLQSTSKTGQSRLRQALNLSKGVI